MSPEAARTVGALLNLVGLGFLLSAHLSAFRDRDRRERATGERPQKIRDTPRGRVLKAVAASFIGVGAVFLVTGIVTG